MKKTILLLSVILLGFMCQATYARSWDNDKEQFQAMSIKRATPNTGPETADYLTQDYMNAAKGCDDDEHLPAFLCSGVMLRGTNYSASYHSWDPSPQSQTSGGVSFSYLRKDSKYNKLAYGYVNGFVFDPFFYAPDGKYTDIDVMCSFPIDASTDNRVDKGCGEYTGHPESTTCQSQNIFTADEWYQHYVQYSRQHASECGFDTSEADEDTYNITDGFYQSILSMAKIATESFGTQNELRLATWAQGMQDTLPIEAFFYISGSSAGLSSAKNDQKDFYNNTTGNMWVPVIKITLPTSSTGNATFTYSDSDQWVLQSKRK